MCPPSSVTIRSTAWRRKAFDADATYNVALPRNLLAGFCTIIPLIEWADANRDALPSRDDYIPAQDHVIRHFAKRMWNRLPNFEEMDIDGNGTLERDEVASAIQALTGEPIQDAALDHFFLCVDGDNDDTGQKFRRSLRGCDSHHHRQHEHARAPIAAAERGSPPTIRQCAVAPVQN